MIRYRPPLVPVLTVALVAAVSLTTRAASSLAGLADTLRITSAANVTLRTSPDPASPAVGQLPLGTEVADVGLPGLDKRWVRVKLADDREGWLLASLTKKIDPAWRWPTFDRIIAERLGRKGDGFQASAELVAFIDRIAPQYTDPDGRGRLEYSRLQAMAATLAAIPPGGSRRDPYQSWLGVHKAELVLDEAGNRWMMSDASIWERHARLASTESGDDVAWFAVTNGLAGECEGRLVCYLNARNRLYGEYLRRYPRGTHAAEAVDVIRSTADLLAATLTSKSAYTFDAKRESKDLSSVLDALTGAVKDTRVTNKDAALASLSALRRLG
ncbi:MAG TPA: SH3 domain-containing protein [Vicinamibacterales bacterium]|nr:SH3 domain-containing protein [Vicinamibacterales bacterium]